MVLYRNLSFMRNILKRHSGTHSGTDHIGQKNLKIGDFRKITRKLSVFPYTKKSIKLTRAIVQLFI